MESDKLEKGFLYGILVIAVIGLIFSFYTIFKPYKAAQETMPRTTSRMSFSAFDVSLAKEFMDQNNDGLCDICGMRIEDCIASGMMQCTMDPDAKIGLLGSQHIHADFKLYTDGKTQNFANPQYFMKSMMLHLDNHQNPEDAGSVLHMHATGVPLWMFLKSIDIDVSSSKVYVNGKLNNNGLEYVFNDLDKLLITDANDEAILKGQLKSVTNYAKDHSGPRGV